MFYFKVNHQKINLSQRLTASDSINYLDACFEFSDDWEGLRKYATFKQSDRVYQVEVINNMINRTAGINLSAGEWIVSIHGNASEGVHVVERITTVPVRLIVEKSGIIDGEPFPSIDPSIGEQIVARATDQADRAEHNAIKAEENAVNASESASNALESESKARSYSDTAVNASNIAVQNKNQTKYYKNEAEVFAERAEQAAGVSGWAEFYIDTNGYLHIIRSDNLLIDFEMNNGYLEVIY